MPVQNGQYKAPTWVNGGPPALDANELNAISSRLEVADRLSSQPAVEVGDIAFTIRTDLGDQYLLCNGDTVTNSKYSTLMSKLKYITPDNVLWTGSNSALSYVTYGNGYYVGWASNKIYYTTDITKPFTLFLPNSYNNVANILFDGSRFVFVTQSQRANEPIYFYYFTNPTQTINTFNFTPLDVSSVIDFYFLNNTYIVVYSKNNNTGTYIAYNKSLSIGFASDITAYVRLYLCYINGMYIGMQNQYNYSASRDEFVITYSTNLTTWTDVNYKFDYSNRGFGTFWYDGKYHFVLIGASYNVDTYVYTMDTLISTFTSVSIGTGFSYPQRASYGYGYLIIARNSSPNGTYYLDATDFTKPYKKINFFGEKLCSLKFDLRNETLICSSPTTICPMNKKVLPIVDGDESYPMIKGYS